MQARKIIQQQAVQQLQTDIQCLKQYELACQRGTVTSKDFNNTMHNASAEAQSYAVNIKNGTGSIQVYANTQKELQASLKATSIASRIANTGIKILSATLNTIISTAIFSLISKGISLATEKINNLIHHNELVIKKATDLFNDFQSDIDSITSNQDKLNSYADEFKNLSTGVDDLGRNISLTADEYLRYQNIVKEIVSINPSLIEGYDKENNILTNKMDCSKLLFNF